MFLKYKISPFLPSSAQTGKPNRAELALILIPPTRPPTWPPTRKSSELAGIQQNLLTNIDRHSQADLKTAFKKLGSSSNLQMLRSFFKQLLIKDVAF